MYVSGKTIAIIASPTINALSWSNEILSFRLSRLELCITLFHLSSWSLQYIDCITIYCRLFQYYWIEGYNGGYDKEFLRVCQLSSAIRPLLSLLSSYSACLALSPPSSSSPTLSRFYCYRLMFMICITQSTWLMFALVVAAFAVAAALAAASLCLQVVVVVLAYVYWQLWQSFSAVAAALLLPPLRRCRQCEMFAMMQNWWQISFFARFQTNFWRKLKWN